MVSDARAQERPEKKLSLTGYVFKPMLVTLKQAITSAVRPNTVLYPYEKLDLPERYRGLHALDFKKCIGCALCVKVCPNECMFMKKIDDPELGKIERPGIDYARCLFCGLCTEVCPRECLFMTPDFELADYSRESLRYDPEDIRHDGYGQEQFNRKLLPLHDFTKCTGHAKCAEVCPTQCITIAQVERTNRLKPEVDFDNCISCGKCVEVCPEGAWKMDQVILETLETDRPFLYLPKCTSCAACARVCPTECIAMTEMPGSEKRRPDGSMTKPKKRPVWDMDKCVGCALCAEACKFDSLWMEAAKLYNDRIRQEAVTV